jgi:hypothetical protein
LVIVLCLASLSAPAARAAAATLYVGADAAEGGDGSQARPFGSLAAVEEASAAGDTIRVVAAKAPLDGGIALKAGQRLIGAGAAAPIENTDASRHDGDAITLADRTEVANVAVVGAVRGGIYGEDVQDVSIHGNDVTGTNTSCTVGFVVQPFLLPTTAPGVAVPFSAGLTNAWAAIMVDAGTVTSTVSLVGNTVHDGTCADGIDVRASGTANVTATVTRNTVTRMLQSVTMESVLGIGLQTRDSSHLTAREDHNSESYIGTAYVGDEGEADSEGLFANAAGPSELNVKVTRNTFAHGLGHLSANCFEVVGSNGGPTMHATLLNSTCDDVVGDILEAASLSANATMTFDVRHVRANHSTFLGASTIHTVLPGDDGDCMLVLASGAGASTSVTIRDSLFTNCVADGIGVVSNVVDGSGPADHLSVDVRNSRITGNALSNVRIANVTGVTELDGRFENTDLSASGGTPIIREALDTSGTTRERLDFGGGALGSRGANCIFGGAGGDVLAVGGVLDMQRNWWGQPGGPAAGKVTSTGTVDTGAPLDAAACGPVAGTTLGPLPECAKRRHVVLRLGPRWVSATARVNGHKVRVVRRHGRLVVRATLPRRAAKLRITGRDRHGRPLHKARRFRPARCRRAVGRTRGR